MPSRLAYALAILVLTGACLLPSDPEVEVSISVGSVVVSPSAPVDVAVTVSNFGPGPVEVSSYSCPPNYDVFDDRGNLVGPPVVLCILKAVPPMVLDAAEAFTFDHSWDGEIRRDGQDVFEAGTFHVEGKVWASGRGVVRSPSVEVRVSTNGTG